MMGLIINAQITDTPEPEKPESHWTLGGYAGLGGSFESGGGTSVYLSPRVGYKASPDLETGLAANFTWSRNDYYSSTMVGVGPFVNYYVLPNFFLSTMFQQYFIGRTNRLDNRKYSADESALYLGGGYMQSLGGRTYMQIGGMYNVLYDSDKSILSGGFIPNIGVVFGL